MEDAAGQEKISMRALRGTLGLATAAMLVLAGCARDEAAVQPPEETYVLEETASIVISSVPDAVYVRVPTDLYISANDLELGAHLKKGVRLDVLDVVSDDAGEVRFYKVSSVYGTGYVRPWYVTDNEDEAYAHYDEALQKLHAQRGDRYGGGDAGGLEYFPRDKEFEYQGKQMPDLARTIYMPCTKNCLDAVDEYIAAADEIGADAIVLDIVDNTVVGYESDVMKEISPRAYEAAIYSREEFKAVVDRIRGAGYYLIARMTAFRDGYLCEDHPEYAISEPTGELKIVTGGYWPSVYCRDVWEYKVAVAKEAVEWFGFDEIQFDYVRFPDGTVKMETSGEIDIKNEYDESRAQAVTGFLMYAADNIHESGAYISADVFGETAYEYVTAYGQYWPAISNVVDVISAMPYPDHYERTDTWIPWMEPYKNMTYFAKSAVQRQTECPTPAKDRTWIQCYDTRKDPAVHYGNKFVGQQIQALYDNGLTGGFITWNSYGDEEHYTEVKKALNMNPGDAAPETDD